MAVKRHIPCRGTGYHPPREKGRRSWPTKPPSCAAFVISRVRTGPSMTRHRYQAALSKDINWLWINTTLYSLCFAGWVKKGQACTHCLSNNHSRMGVQRPPPPVRQLPNTTNLARAPPPKIYASYLMQMPLQTLQVCTRLLSLQEQQSVHIMPSGEGGNPLD